MLRGKLSLCTMNCDFKKHVDFLRNLSVLGNFLNFVQ